MVECRSGVGSAAADDAADQTSGQYAVADMPGQKWR